MLEILMVWYFGKKVGETAERKGYSGSLFTILFVAMWFFGELLVLIPGIGLAESRGGSALCGVYALALMAAVFLSFLVFFIVLFLPDAAGRRRPDKLDFDQYGHPIRRRKRRRARPRFDDDHDEEPRRRPRPKFDDDYEEEPRRRPRAKFDEDEEEPPRPRRRREAEFDDEDERISPRRKNPRPRREEFDDD
jgi:hypothetical protein